MSCEKQGKDGEDKRASEKDVRRHRGREERSADKGREHSRTRAQNGEREPEKEEKRSSRDKKGDHRKDRRESERHIRDEDKEKDRDGDRRKVCHMSYRYTPSFPTLKQLTRDAPVVTITVAQSGDYRKCFLGGRKRL